MARRTSKLLVIGLALALLAGMVAACNRTPQAATGANSTTPTPTQPKTVSKAEAKAALDEIDAELTSLLETLDSLDELEDEDVTP